MAVKTTGTVPVLKELSAHGGANIRPRMTNVVSIMKSGAQALGDLIEAGESEKPSGEGDLKGVGGCRKERALSSGGNHK